MSPSKNLLTKKYQMSLLLKNVSKTFIQADQKITAIRDVNLEIKEGELVALTGPSGSGKTTLLQIAGLLDSPSSGEILIGGVNASNADDKTRTELRKNHLGFVYQFHHLLPEFSALENVALPLLIQGHSRSEAFARATETLKKVDLAERLNHKPAQLSGGQQQRVALARAIVGKPKIILADEPTGNLDSELSGKIFTLLCELTKSHGIGCLVVTHNLELAKKSDRVVSIRDGMIS